VGQDQLRACAIRCHEEAEEGLRAPPSGEVPLLPRRCDGWQGQDELEGRPASRARP